MVCDDSSIIRGTFTRLLEEEPDFEVRASLPNGAQALLSVLKALPYDRQLPVFITQHMPATFTRIFAEQLSKSTAWPCDEATDGQSVSGGRIYLAPGDWHILIAPEEFRLAALHLRL